MVLKLIFRHNTYDMKRIILMSLLLASFQQLFSQSTEWLRVGPKGFGIDPANNNGKLSSSRTNTIRFSYGPSATDPTIFVSTYLGIFKTEDNGESFSPIANFTNPNWIDDNRMTDFIVHPDNPNFLVVAVVNGKILSRIYDMHSHQIYSNSKQLKKIDIYKTQDEGLTWVNINNFSLPSGGDEDNIKFVNEFLFSPDKTILYAATNYGLYQCNITATNPTWTHVSFFNYENISDITFNPSATSTNWTLYASGKKIGRLTNSSSTWANISISTDPNLCYLAFGPGETLIAKRIGTGYLDDNAYDCSLGDEDKSINKNRNSYKIYEYNQSSGVWTDKVTLHDYGWEGYEDWCVQMINDNAGNLYLGRRELIKVNTSSGYSISKESEYWNQNCTATHADIMDMCFDHVRNKIYVSSHGTFGIYNPGSGSICQKWDNLAMAGLPGSHIKNVASSPFSNGQLMYSVWDQNKSTFCQIGDYHYGIRARKVADNGTIEKTDGDFEHMQPFFYINDRVYITSRVTNTQGDPYFIGPSSANQITCYEYGNPPSGNAVEVNLDGINLFQIKRGKDTPPGSFYYVDGRALWYVQNVVHASDITTALSSKQFIVDIRTDLGYTNYNLHRMNVIDSKNIFLILSNGPYFANWGGTSNYLNKVIKTSDGGTSWTEITLPSGISSLSYTHDKEFCPFYIDAPETYIKKFIADPYRQNRYYLVMGTLQEASNISTIYLTENGGTTWNKVFHQFADIVGSADYDGYSGNRPQLTSSFYLQGLPTLSDGVILPCAEDFDLNPNTGDPMLVTNLGVYYKKNGFPANTNWERYYYSSSTPKVQPRNARYIDINTSFNKMYTAGAGGIFVADIPCFNESTPLVLSSFENEKLYQTSTTITSSSAVPAGYSITVRAGESIALTAGFSVVGTGSGSSFTTGCPYSSMPYNDVRIEPSFPEARTDAFSDTENGDKEDEIWDAEISAFPNPTFGNVTIVSKLKKKNISSLVLMSSIGQSLLEVNNINETKYELDLAPYQGEFFILQVVIGSKKKTVKLVKFNTLKEGEMDK